MFGSQCAYVSGHWDVWNQQTGHWVQTGLACKRFTPNVWHHIVWNVHRTSGEMHFDSLTLDGQVNTINMAEPSGPLPKGWSDSLCNGNWTRQPIQPPFMSGSTVFS